MAERLTELSAPDEKLREGALETFSAACAPVAESTSLDEALAVLARAVASAANADLVVLRTLEPGALFLTARAVVASSPALAAELEGSHVTLADLPDEEADAPGSVPAAVLRTANRMNASAYLVVPALFGSRTVGCVELIRGGAAFTPDERAAVRLAAAYSGLAIGAFAGSNGEGDRPLGAGALELAGDALAAGSGGPRTSSQIARLAAEATGALSCAIWRARDGQRPELVASFGVPEPAGADGEAAAAAERALHEQRPVLLEPLEAREPGGAAFAANLRLGEPAVGVLQLFFSAETVPADADFDRLATFGVRAAHALRASEKAGRLSVELERTRALLAVVGQAIARLSLSHTLETAVDRVAELLGAERLAVYLREEGRLHAAAERGIAGPHVGVADCLLELALGPFRARGLLFVDDAAQDPRLESVREAVAEVGIESALAVPLLVHEELIGLLVVYLPRGRVLAPNESALLLALAVQLAVAVQNARLHEQTKTLAAERERALASEQQTAGQLRALYEISRSFVQSLSLEATLDAVTRTVVELLDVDVAVLRTPDDRGDQLIARSVQVADARLGEAVRPILARPQPLEKLPGRRLFAMGRPLVLDVASARSLGASYELLVPFLEQGSTVVVLPVATAAEMLATLTLMSLDPDRPITEETIEVALTIVGQAALAIDNARLYQQQKGFADTMQRSLLPRSLPEIEGLELGDVYESSARVDVGGDVYDFLVLEDGRLAVVLGDVTGHGIDAAADMAMAKFVFRSLAREHPDPGDFLAHANEVVHDEVSAGKFVTMAYVTLDPRSGELKCASAGHPPPRVVRPDGSVVSLDARGLALGIDSDQRYDEIHETLPPGAAVVLYTDGVLEARRRSGEQYGEQRLDRLLAERHELPADRLAAEVLADCRTFAGGDLGDDCAIVVLKRT